MLSVTSTELLVITVGLLSVYALWRSVARRSRARYPPGPKGVFILGNLLQWPKRNEWETFTQWGRMYGDLVMVKLLGQRMLILNSPQAAVDLLDKKSNIYSDRPSMPMCGELCEFDRTLVLTPHGERTREMRKIIHVTLAGKETFKRNGEAQEREIRQFLKRIMTNSGANLQKDIRNLAGAIMMNITYGYEVPEGSAKDPLVQLIEQSVDDFAETSIAGAYLVDSVALLRYVPEWVPGARFKKIARDVKRRLAAVIDTPYEVIKAQMDEGTAMIVKETLFSLIGGGANTVESSLVPIHTNSATVSAEYSFYLAMTLHPEVQAKAQAEIDHVIGPDRLPTLEDRERLPYVEAVVKEVFRWNPVTPQGIPHKLREDDVHDGYFIPKGTICIPNIWGFLHDPEVYMDPMVFEPERFIGRSGKAAEQDPRTYTFGYGRRICPGRHLADTSLFLIVAMTLAALDIQPTVDKDGNSIMPLGEYTGGLINHPRAFPCVVKARSAHAEALISHASGGE